MDSSFFLYSISCILLLWAVFLFLSRMTSLFTTNPEKYSLGYLSSVFRLFQQLPHSQESYQTTVCYRVILKLVQQRDSRTKKYLFFSLKYSKDVDMIRQNATVSQPRMGCIKEHTKPICFPYYFLCIHFRYILELHRIPAKTKGSRAVFIQHGILGSSGHWIINPASSSLRIHFYYSILLSTISLFNFYIHAACLLADLGYDVWLGNLRGNVYSRAHVRLNPKGSEYWKFW